jgi:hypothetical protein
LLVEPEPEREAPVFAHPTSHVLAVDEDGNACLGEHVAGADARELQELWTAHTAEGADDLAVRTEFPIGAVGRPDFDADGAIVLDDEPADRGVRDDVQVVPALRGLEEGVHRAVPTSVSDGGRGVADSRIVRFVDVLKLAEAGAGARADDLAAQGIRPPPDRHVKRSPDSAGRRRPEFVVLEALEDRQDVVPAPALVAEALQLVVVGPIPPVVDHAVDGTRPAEHLAAGPELGSLIGAERRGAVPPRVLVVLHEHRRALGHVEHRMAVGSARLDQQNLGAGIGR